MMAIPTKMMKQTPMSDTMVGDNFIVKFFKHHGKCGDEIGQGVSVSVYIKNQMKTELKSKRKRSRNIIRTFDTFWTIRMYIPKEGNLPRTKVI